MTFAAPVVIPGSAFPIATTLNSDDRLLVVRTNSSPSTNVTIRFDDLRASLDELSSIAVIASTNELTKYYSFSNAVASAGSNIVYLNTFTNHCNSNMVWMTPGQALIGRSSEKSVILTDSDSLTVPGTPGYNPPGAIAAADNCILENFTEFPFDAISSLFPITAVNTQRRWLVDAGVQTTAQFSSTSTNVIVTRIKAYGGKNWTIVLDGTNNTSWTFNDCYVQNAKLIALACGTVEQDFGVSSEGTTNALVPLPIRGTYVNTVNGGTYKIQNELANVATPTYSAPFYVNHGTLTLNGPNCYISSDKTIGSTNYATCAVVSGTNTYLFANPSSVSSQGTFSNAPDIILTTTSTNCTVVVAANCIKNVRDLGVSNNIVWLSRAYYNATNSTMPTPLTGYVINWYSNYDTWQVTPFKTNRIAQGQ